MVLYFASDLIWATRIKATAESVGIAARPVRNVDMLRARLGDSPVTSLILDLEAGEPALEVLAALRGGEAGPGLDPEGKVRVVAFGPHVKVDELGRARAGGADRVMTRGAFDARLVDLLRELDQPA